MNFYSQQGDLWPHLFWWLYQCWRLHRHRRGRFPHCGRAPGCPWLPAECPAPTGMNLEGLSSRLSCPVGIDPPPLHECSPCDKYRFVKTQTKRQTNQVFSCLYCLCRNLILPAAQPLRLRVWKGLPGWVGGGRGWCWQPPCLPSAGGRCHWLWPMLTPGEKHTGLVISLKSF